MPVVVEREGGQPLVRDAFHMCVDILVADSAELFDFASSGSRRRVNGSGRTFSANRSPTSAAIFKIPESLSAPFNLFVLRAPIVIIGPNTVRPRRESRSGENRSPRGQLRAGALSHRCRAGSGRVRSTEKIAIRRRWCTGSKRVTGIVKDGRLAHSRLGHIKPAVFMPLFPEEGQRIREDTLGM